MAAEFPQGAKPNHPECRALPIPPLYKDKKGNIRPHLHYGKHGAYELAEFLEGQIWSKIRTNYVLLPELRERLGVFLQYRGDLGRLDQESPQSFPDLGALANPESLGNISTLLEILDDLFFFGKLAPTTVISRMTPQGSTVLERPLGFTIVRRNFEDKSTWHVTEGMEHGKMLIIPAGKYCLIAIGDHVFKEGPKITTWLELLDGITSILLHEMIHGFLGLYCCRCHGDTCRRAYARYIGEKGYAIAWQAIAHITNAAARKLIAETIDLKRKSNYVHDSVHKYSHRRLLRLESLQPMLLEEVQIDLEYVQRWLQVLKYPTPEHEKIPKGIKRFRETRANKPPSKVQELVNHFNYLAAST